MNVTFPTDRVVYFSDAIFAIAITLLVLEIKIPTHEQLIELGTLAILQKMIPLFIGFLVSFLVTALFWRSHLILFSYVKHIDNRLLWLNIWLLFSVALLPFSSGFYSSHAEVNGPYFFYCIHLSFIGLFSYLMTSHIVRSENLKQSLGEIKTRWMIQRTLLVPLVFLLCIPLSLISLSVGRLGFLLVFVLQSGGNHYYGKKIARTVN